MFQKHHCIFHYGFLTSTIYIYIYIYIYILMAKKWQIKCVHKIHTSNYQKQESWVNNWKELEVIGNTVFWQESKIWIKSNVPPKKLPSDSEFRSSSSFYLFIHCSIYSFNSTTVANFLLIFFSYSISSTSNHLDKRFKNTLTLKDFSKPFISHKDHKLFSCSKKTLKRF